MKFPFRISNLNDILVAATRKRRSHRSTDTSRRISFCFIPMQREIVNCFVSSMTDSVFLTHAYHILYTFARFRLCNLLSFSSRKLLLLSLNRFLCIWKNDVHMTKIKYGKIILYKFFSFL